MNEVENLLKEYYDTYDEDARLVKDKAHSLEFITTTKYIEKYLKKGDRILEIGAGTGRYSINYASKGYKVNSLELIEKNIKIFETKITKDMDIEVVQGNALNLYMYKDNAFDVTLVLGPLYHLYTDDDVNQAINEAIRVTKKGGKIFFAYITDDAVVLSYGLRRGNLKRLKSLCDENWNVPKLKEEIFATYKVSDFDKLMEKFELKRFETVATDGIAPNIPNYINNLTDEEFEMYVDYHLKNCGRKDLIGYSSHVLEIVEKK